MRGNGHKVERDLDEIVRRYLAGEVTTKALCKEYHVAPATLAKRLCARTRPDQRAAIWRLHRSRVGRGNAVKIDADLDEIVRRYLADEVSIGELMTEYRVAYLTLTRRLHARTTPEQRAAVDDRRRCRANRPTRFQKGHATWNKGVSVRLSPGSEFKLGHQRNVMAIGTIRVRRDTSKTKGRRGLRRQWIKVADEREPGDWICLARHVWAEANGPVPAGHRVVHVDGDAMNDELGNLRLMTGAESIAHEYATGQLTQEHRREACRRGAARRRKANAAKRREKAEERKQREHRRNHARGLRELRGPLRVVWLCPECGYDKAGGAVPARCPKCGGQAFERLRLRRRELHFNGRRSGRRTA